MAVDGAGEGSDGGVGCVGGWGWGDGGGEEGNEVGVAAEGEDVGDGLAEPAGDEDGAAGVGVAITLKDAGEGGLGDADEAGGIDYGNGDDAATGVEHFAGDEGD